MTAEKCKQSFNVLSYSSFAGTKMHGHLSIVSDYSNDCAANEYPIVKNVLFTYLGKTLLTIRVKLIQPQMTEGWFPLDTAVCVFCSGLRQCRHRKFSISLCKCNHLLQMHVLNAVMCTGLDSKFNKNLLTGAHAAHRQVLLDPDPSHAGWPRWQSVRSRRNRKNGIGESPRRTSRSTGTNAIKLFLP